MQFRDYKSKVLKTIDDEDLLDSGMICVVFSDISGIFFIYRKPDFLITTNNESCTFLNVQSRVLLRENKMHSDHHHIVLCHSERIQIF